MLASLALTRSASSVPFLWETLIRSQENGNISITRAITNEWDYFNHKRMRLFQSQKNETISITNEWKHFNHKRMRIFQFLPLDQEHEFTSSVSCTQNLLRLQTSCKSSFPCRFRFLSILRVLCSAGRSRTSARLGRLLFGCPFLLEFPNQSFTSQIATWLPSVVLIRIPLPFEVVFNNFFTTFHSNPLVQDFLHYEFLFLLSHLLSDCLDKDTQGYGQG